MSRFTVTHAYLCCTRTNHTVQCSFAHLMVSFFSLSPVYIGGPVIILFIFFVVVVISSEIVGHDARIVLVCAMHSLVYVSLSHSAQQHHLINTLANVVVVAIIMSNSRHLLDFVAIYLFYFFFGCLSVRLSITHSHNNNIS